ncbi:MAG: hypothetical protein PHV92_03375 [Candidatus Omnitrophica bacterium]|nr:hypothetical protein [Candidatus Omnitrophota bacterium]MDD5517958.1 hypothetical protein [Candidatus Omnitrophota bacterium]
MKRRIATILGIIGLGVLLNTGLALSQDEPKAKEPSLAAPQEKNESDTQWVWGEVTSVDTQNKTLALKYLDYDTDEEKELLITVDNLTSYENVRSLEEIQVKDSVSIDYISGAGKNTAMSVSLEKAEAAGLQAPVAQ